MNGDADTADKVAHRSLGLHGILRRSRDLSIRASRPGQAGELRAAIHAFTLLFVVGLGPSGRATDVRSTPTHPASIAYRNTAPAVAYVGSAKCAPCHQDIYDRYTATGMGRSMSLPSEASQLAKVASPVKVVDENLRRHYQVFRDGSRIFESEYEVDSGGNQLFKRTAPLEYVIGSGMVGETYIIQADHYLFQAPLSFYSRPNTWELSPGYRFHDDGFSRPILTQCLACHSGRPAPLGARRASPFNADPFAASNPPFHELAIGCENCHGPGQLHVEERLKGAPVSGEADTAIVNPSKLPRWLANNICMNCHQAGDARVLKPGKTLLDFRPGTPIDDTLAIFQMPLDPESPAPSPLLGHYYGMILSKCYAASGEKLSCLSCHNPHEQPSAQEAPAYFRNRCLACHTEKSCTLPLEARQRRQPADDCEGCHMLKRDLTTISHAALTDHRIVAREGEPYPDVAFHQTTTALPDLVHIDAVPGKPDQVPRLTLLEAYAELAAAVPAKYQQPYLGLLDQAAHTNPDDLLVLSALAQKALWEGKPEGQAQAERYLRRAIDLGSTYPADYLRLAELLARGGHQDESAQVLEKGLRIAPYNSLFYQMLAIRYAALGRQADAAAVARKGAEAFPEDSALRALKNKLGDGTGTRP